MKNFTRLFKFILVFGSLTFIQCSDEEKIKSNSTAVSITDPNEVATLSNFISKSLNIELNKISFVETKNNFVIDGDAFISLKDAREHYTNSNSSNTGKTAQRKTPFTMTPGYSSTIQIYVSPDVPNDWKTAINQAIINWNNINSNITISPVNSPTPTSINIQIYFDSATSVIAFANFPDANGNSGNSITINTYYNSLSPTQKTFAITHEMGHNFGFTHTDNSTSSELIPCTPTSDPNSVMNAVVSNWINFSPYDNIAISTLYPLGLNTKKLYRYTKGISNLYTTDPCEKGSGDGQFNFNGDICYLYSSALPGTVPLYRIYKTNISDYNYYTSTSPSSNRIEGYLYPTQQPGTTPLYSYETMDAKLWRQYREIAYHQEFSTINRDAVGLNKKILGYVIVK